MTPIRLALLTLLLACAPALAAPPTDAELDAADARQDEGLAALDREDYRTGLRLLGEAARLAQDGELARRVSQLYRSALDDRASARQWLLYAAERGDPQAMHDVGQSLLDGDDGWARDVPRGLQLLQAAARAGHAPAFGAADRYRQAQDAKARCLRDALSARGLERGLAGATYFHLSEGADAEAAGDAFVVTGFADDTLPDRAKLRVDGVDRRDSTDVGGRRYYNGFYTARPASAAARQLGAQLRAQCGVAD